MTKSKLLTSESGLAHLGLILVVLAVLGLTGFAAFNVVNSNQVAQQESEYLSEDELTDDSSATASDDGIDVGDEGDNDDDTNI